MKNKTNKTFKHKMQEIDNFHEEIEGLLPRFDVTIPEQIGVIACCYQQIIDRFIENLIKDDTPLRPIRNLKTLSNKMSEIFDLSEEIQSKDHLILDVSKKTDKRPPEQEK